MRNIYNYQHHPTSSGIEKSYINFNVYESEIESSMQTNNQDKIDH